MHYAVAYLFRLSVPLCSAFCRQAKGSVTRDTQLIVSGNRSSRRAELPRSKAQDTQG